ncbi:hypothetical protein CJO09_14935 [Neopusillimonas maritima]|jgi:hypothetical protein|uniref:Uncharacterized protein n=1 Tax=Neopusillimonas maritima TaxID=2026239 RepID=A0A3A1YNH2_9BURK|nr:hypothetical protein [Pusillimonas sp.]RII81750.1 hypothetical protein CJO09_14935 [Neopusillimonas maritima]RIY39101.1 hypothetical protein CJP73_15345 [Neopusillimonas maritima]|tara:strand:+ start:1541 stop:1726 length:186 start_codon:yes stop_codon:yes gene_type:complete
MAPPPPGGGPAISSSLEQAPKAVAETNKNAAANDLYCDFILTSLLAFKSLIQKIAKDKLGW